jgi:hypothetical protein
MSARAHRHQAEAERRRHAEAALAGPRPLARQSAAAARAGAGEEEGDVYGGHRRQQRERTPRRRVTREGMRGVGKDGWGHQSSWTSLTSKRRAMNDVRRRPGGARRKP